ncbi:MAG: glycosyltransferase family 4 protein [Bacteroidales bacterium]|nr:glycosyltransferase family 4 protein [Bacteroidales bacterium]
MRIAVNTRLLIKNKLDGIGWFSYETLRRICKDHPEHEFIFIFDRPWDPEFIFEKNVIPVKTGPPSRHPFLWFLWFEVSLPRVLRKMKADLFLSPDGFLSIRSKCPSIAVIHDINFFHRPKDLPFFSRLYYNFFFPKYARKSLEIGTVSNFSKTDIMSSYGIPPEKICVMHNGANEIYKPLQEKDQIKFRAEFSGGDPYFIFVGTLHPRKNLVNLLRAFDEFRKASPKTFKLVVVGARFFLTEELDAVYKSMKFSHDVIFKGRMEAGELAKAVASAEALTFVPFYEGFGIPVVEAMKCNIPVITSNVTSLPEVAGDAALYANPGKVEEISAAMKRIVFEPGLRKDLIEKGKLRAPLYNWDNTAGALWEMIERHLQG